MSFKTKILKLDSSKSKKYYNKEKTSFEFQLENSISVTNNESIVYSLVNAYIPYSFYSLNDNNNYLDVSETINNLTTTRSIQIQPGNYSAYELSRVLMGLLNTSTISYNIVYNKPSNTFTIYTASITTTSIFLFETGEHSEKSCHLFVGLPKSDTIINHDQFQTNMINMNNIYYLQLKSDIGSSNNYLTSDNNDGLLDIINVSDAPLNFISYSPTNPSKFLLHSNTLNSINIALQDNNNNPLDLNGIPYMVTLRIDIINSEEHNIAVAMGRHNMSNVNKTNLEMIMEQPDIVYPATSVNISDMIEYNIIQRMLKKVKRSKK